ncbi:glutaredoxin [Candidatus Riesia sp. GBBU]|nr:glutaredoxin [Candidatus Riesia sp. GBBU]
MKFSEEIKIQLKKNPIILYMKGTPDFPLCGYSKLVSDILLRCCKKFAYVDVLKHENIRKKLPEYSKWPTFPQLWINENLIGGCETVKDLYINGSLKKIISQTKFSKNLK